MSTILVEERIVIPDRVRNLQSFRRWAHSDEFPAEGRFAWLGGKLWADFSMEELFTHNLLKTGFTTVLGSLVGEAELGYYLSDGMFFSNLDADVATEPDGLFISFDALETGRVRLVRTRRGCMEVTGAPEMALEIVSFSSVGKDKKLLRERYHRAGIREYWLVDVRQPSTRPLRRPSKAKPSTVRFDILRHTADGYVAAEKSGGWARSDVFDRSFRLKRGADRLGNPQFTLEVR